MSSLQKLYIYPYLSIPFVSNSYKKNVWAFRSGVNDIIHKFLLLPKDFSSKELKLRIKLDGEPFPASKTICKSFCKQEIKVQ
jgi:hypothetical protein